MINFRDFLEEQFKDEESKMKFNEGLRKLRIKVGLEYRRERGARTEEIKRRNLMRKMRLRDKFFEKRMKEREVKSGERQRSEE